MIKLLTFLLLCFTAVYNESCSEKIEKKEESIYSRHLQRHVKLTILYTPVPDDKSLYNLLLLNDGQDMGQLRVQQTMDSLYDKKLIAPLFVVAIHSQNRNREYGVAGFPDYENNGSDAQKYSAFIDNELYPYLKKKSGVRKFASITIAGCSLGGLSAFDIAWNNADKIDKVGVFSGSFWWRNKDASASDYSDEINRIMLKKLRSSRKKPQLKYWFYAGGSEEKGDRDKDGIIDVVDDTRDLIHILKSKNVCPSGDIVFIETKEGTHGYYYWSKVFPEFLTWAIGK